MKHRTMMKQTSKPMASVHGVSHKKSGHMPAAGPGPKVSPVRSRPSGKGGYKGASAAGPAKRGGY